LKKIFSLIALIILPILFNACSTPQPVIKKEKIIPVDRILKRIEANRRKVKSFYGTGVLKIESNKFSATANFEVVIKKPDSIKISVFGPFGLDVGEILLTGDGYLFYDAFRNILYSGKDKTDILDKLFKVNFNFNDVFDAFAGSVNLSDKLNALPYKAEENESNYFFTYTNESIRTVYQIDKKELFITNYTLYDGEKKEIISKYEDFSKIDGVVVPYKINIKYPKEEASINIDYREIKVNKINYNLILDVPQDVKRINL